MSTQTTAIDRLDPVRAPDDPLPFRAELSLAPLIAFWEQAAEGRDPVRAAMARIVSEQLARAPELREPIRDLAVMERHRPLVDSLMSVVFPRASWSVDFQAALIPLNLRSFYATPLFERLFLGDGGALRGRLNVDESAVYALRLVSAYTHLLRRFYDVDLDVEHPIIVTVPDPATGLDRHFKLGFDVAFIQVEPVGPLPVLTEAQRQQLIGNPSDVARLLALIPPERFVFRGFTVLRAADVTEQEIMSALKRDLIERESIVANEPFLRLQQRLQALFKRPELELGLAAIDGEQVFLLNSSHQIEHGCIFADSTHHRVSDFAGSIFERAVLQRRPIFIDDLAECPGRGPREETLLQKRIRSIVVAPLVYQDATIGTMYLAARRPGAFNPGHSLMLEEVLPLFSMAVKRSMDELNARIQAFIKEQCTAIHPSVEWRFRKAVLRSIEQSGPDAAPALEPIVFENVYPLYGVTDIRGSSTQRNAAIQADLTTHLHLAQDVVRAAFHARDLPILDAIAHRIGTHIDDIALGVKSGDELGILNFLRKHVEPVFPQLGALGGEVALRLEAYRSAVDPRLGTVYRRRKAFDESVTLLNDAISAYLEAEEDRAQAMIPHYFEKQRTDGVDFNIYVGAALIESGQFDLLFLRNLRLWQLMVLCGIARRTAALRPRLAVPLETTHLVLAHHAPLAIRFRLDEKRFDVDGAYNVRYEVTKKRIDKATIKGTADRLTQPGQIAIVYAQPGEAAEYREYIEYLQARGDLGSGLEELQLDELQGVEGLRALRVTVNVQNPSGAEDSLPGATRLPLGNGRG
jgi:GAF domain-containing protein